MTRIFFFLFALMVLGSPTLFAQSADEAEVAFRLGNTAYTKGNYEEAIGHYFRSNRLAPNANVTFNIAKCFEALQQYVEAYRYYSSFSREAKTDAERKAVAPALKRIKKRVALVDVTTHPTGASIYVGRVELGEVARGPATIPLLPGKHTIVVATTGYNTITLTEEVTAGTQVARDVTLEPVLGSVKLEGPERTVRLTVGDLVVDAKIPSVVELPTGAQRLEVSADAHATLQIDINLKEADNPPIQIALQPIVGTLVATSTETDSQILVDGELRGFTPAVVDLSVGEHDVTISKPGFVPVQQSVSLGAGQRVTVDVELFESSNVRAASGLDEQISKAPASVSVITAQEIDAFGYRGTADALTGTRGIFFTNDLTYRLIGVRGFGPFGQFGNRVLVQLDGHAINDSWIGASFHEFELMSEIFSLDRIEVVRGPNSVLYGSGAFQGVVNLVSPDVTQVTSRRLGATAISDGVFRAYGSASQPFDDGGALLSAGYVHGQSNGYTSDTRIGSVEFPDGRADDVGGFDAYTFRGLGTWRFLTLSAFFHKRDQNVPTGAYETLFGDGRTREADQRFFTDLESAFDISETLTLKANAALDGYQYFGDFAYADADGGLQKDRFDGVWTTFTSELIWRASQTTRVVFGLSGARHLKNDANSRDEDGLYFEQASPFTQFSTYANVRQAITSWLEFYGGARFDVWAYDALPIASGGSERKTVSNVNPRVAMIFSPTDDDTIKAIGSRGFRAPSVYELSYNDEGQTQISNPAIDPEHILSAELEYQRRFGRAFAVTSVFANRINQPIAQTGAGEATDPFIYDNTDAPVQTVGAEFEFRRPFFRGWMVSANYSIQRTEIGDLDRLFDAPQFVNSPVHTGGVKFVAPLVPPMVKLSTRASIVSARLDRTGEKSAFALLWDVGAYGKLPSTPVHYSLRLENVLDWKIEHPTGDEIDDPRVVQSPRTIVFDLSVRF